ncbi:hypothetical protein [Lysobacter gummosus]
MHKLMLRGDAGSQPMLPGLLWEELQPRCFSIRHRDLRQKHRG